MVVQLQPGSFLMPLVRRVSTFVLLTIGLAVAANAQTDKTFPNDDEIKLVLTQTERTMQQYKPLIDQEENLMGKDAADAAANDRRVVAALEKAVKAFKQQPQGFNGPLGFAFFEWLDDASRNAALCGNGASMQAVLAIMKGKPEKADSLLRLAQSCMDMSTLIYTISENAGALYLRYAEAEEQLAAKGADVADKCMAILKKNGYQPKPQR
jgi:hypothetical protein